MTEVAISIYFACDDVLLSLKNILKTAEYIKYADLYYLSCN